MGVFGAFFGCIGVVGFKGCCSGVRSGDGGFTLACISGCRGVVGFTVTTSVRPVREKVRPAGSGGGCEREKVRPAWLVGGDSGRKFAMCGQNAPNWAILGEQGEFCPAHAVRRGVLGEFCTAWHWPRALVLSFRCLWALWPDPAGFGMTIMLVAVGVLQHEELTARVSHL